MRCMSDRLPRRVGVRGSAQACEEDRKRVQLLERYRLLVSRPEGPDRLPPKAPECRSGPIRWRTSKAGHDRSTDVRDVGCKAGSGRIVFTLPSTTRKRVRRCYI